MLPAAFDAPVYLSHAGNKDLGGFSRPLKIDSI